MSGYDATLAGRQKRATLLILAFIGATWVIFFGVNVMAAHRPLSQVTAARALGEAATALVVAAVAPWIFWGVSQVTSKPKSFSFGFWALCLVPISCLMLVGQNLLRP
jgi:hypothetical protein